MLHPFLQSIYINLTDMILWTIQDKIYKPKRLELPLVQAETEEPYTMLNLDMLIIPLFHIYKCQLNQTQQIQSCIIVETHIFQCDIIFPDYSMMFVILHKIVISDHHKQMTWKKQSLLLLYMSHYFLISFHSSFLFPTQMLTQFSPKVLSKIC